MSDVLSICWSEYNRLQRFADCQKLDRRSWGIDEALSELLARMFNSTLPELSEWLDGLAHERGCRLGRTIDRPEGLRVWLRNLATNRAKKHRAGAPIEVARTIAGVDAQPSMVEMADELLHVRSYTTDNEWHVLWGVANGDSYRELANQRGTLENSLKSLVLRCRRRIATCLKKAV